MNSKLFLVAYAVAVLALTLFHSVYFLVVANVVLLMLAGKDALALAKKAFYSVAAFSLIISLSYAATLFYKHESALEYLLMINLRVFALVFMTFLFSERVNVYEALSFSKTLGATVTLAASQISVYKKLLHHYYDAMRSRYALNAWHKKPNEFFAQIVYHFLNKTIHGSRESFDALKSRGFFCLS